MGNACLCPSSSESKETSRHRDVRSPSESHSTESEEPTSAWTQDNLNSHLDELMKAMQQHNLKRMREEVEKDMNTFMLNNLLMGKLTYR